MLFGRSFRTCSSAAFASVSLPSVWYALASWFHAFGSFGCAFASASALFTPELTVVPLLPKTLKFPRSRSPIPDPEPTPKKTKPAAKTNASRTNTHFAWRRRRGKNIVDSMLGAWRADACRRLPDDCCLAALRRAWAAPRAMPRLGYLDLRGRDGIPVERLADGAQALARAGVAEGTLQPCFEETSGLEPERARSGVVAGEVGSEHRRIVGGDRAQDGGLAQPPQGVLFPRRRGAGEDVGDRTDVEHDPAFGELAQQLDVVDRPDPVANP